MSLQELERRSRLTLVGLPLDTPCPQCRHNHWWHCICAQFPPTDAPMEVAIRRLGVFKAERIRLKQQTQPVVGDRLREAGFGGERVHVVSVRSTPDHIRIREAASGVPAEKQKGPPSATAILAALPDLGLPWPFIESLEVGEAGPPTAPRRAYALRAVVAGLHVGIGLSFPPFGFDGVVEWHTLRNFPNVRAWRSDLFRVALAKADEE